MVESAIRFQIPDSKLQTLNLEFEILNLEFEIYPLPNLQIISNSIAVTG